MDSMIVNNSDQGHLRLDLMEAYLGPPVSFAYPTSEWSDDQTICTT